MERLSKFRKFSGIDTGSIWGGMTTCWTHVVDKGGTTDPCGNSDDQHYMVNDDGAPAAVSAK